MIFKYKPSVFLSRGFRLIGKLTTVTKAYRLYGSEVATCDTFTEHVFYNQ